MTSAPGREASITPIRAGALYGLDALPHSLKISWKGKVMTDFFLSTHTLLAWQAINHSFCLAHVVTLLMTVTSPMHFSVYPATASAYSFLYMWWSEVSASLNTLHCVRSTLEKLTVQSMVQCSKENHCKNTRQCTVIYSHQYMVHNEQQITIQLLTYSKRNYYHYKPQRFVDSLHKD